MFVAWRGSPCEKCHDRVTRGLVKRAAAYGDLCPKCFLAATPAERAAALAQDRQDRSDRLHARFALFVLERETAALMADLAEFGGETT